MAVFAFYIVEFPAGGTGTAVLHTANGLVRNGHRVVIYTAHHMVDAYPVGYKPLFDVVIVPTVRVETNENLTFFRKHIIENHVDVLVVVAMHFERLCELKKDNHCKIVYALHGMPFYEETFLNTIKRKQAEAPGRHGLWLAYWLIHHWRYKYLHSNRKKILPVYRDTLSASDRYVVLCNEYVKTMINVLKPSYSDAQKIISISNGIVLPEKIVRQKEKIILFVGRLTYEDKRPMRLVEIWGRIYKKIPDWKFVVVGDGPELQAMKEAVCRLNIERMEFPGFTTDTVSFYQRASIICLTSECEGWPLCLAEGQAYGVVPIAFNCSAGIRDIIGTSEKYGLLVKPFNNKAFAKQLLRLATDNRLLSLSNNVIEKSKQYNIQRNSEGYRNLLESLI